MDEQGSQAQQTRDVSHSGLAFSVAPANEVTGPRDVSCIVLCSTVEAGDRTVVWSLIEMSFALFFAFPCEQVSQELFVHKLCTEPDRES